MRACSTLIVWLMLIAVASAQAVDWPYYTSDLGGTKYSPAAEIGPDNFDQLRVVWRFSPTRSADIRDGRARPRL